MTVARPLVLVGDVPSTQDVALGLARAGARDGIVVADAQSAGRGRQGTTWADVPGSSLLSSRILRPERPLQELPTLSLVAGIAVAEAVRLLGVDARLKWPNDVLVGGRKLAGILVELHVPEPLAILGIGINVRPPPALPGDPSALPPISLAEVGAEADRLTVLRLVLDRFDELYAVWSASGFGRLAGRFGALDALAGEEVEAAGAGAGAAIRGIARGVDATGALLLETATGRRSVTSGAVRHVRTARPSA